MINWRKRFPITRTALGLLGKDGWVSSSVAKWLLNHEALMSVRWHCKEHLGRSLTASSVQSRLVHHEEVDWIKENDPESYTRGANMKDSLVVQLKKAGMTRQS
jgi:hypothetical protein